MQALAPKAPRSIDDDRHYQDVPVGWGAAIIDAQGREVPITESMISRACEELAGSWIFPRRNTAIVR